MVRNILYDFRRRGRGYFWLSWRAVLVLYDALGKSSLQHVLTRHEQGQYMLLMLCRVSGKTGLFCYFGGATNL